MYKFLKISDRKGLITYFLVCIIALSFIGILNQYSLSVPEDLKNSLGITFYWTAMKHFIFIIFGVIFLFFILMSKLDLLDKILNNDIILFLFLLISIGSVVTVPFLGKRVNGARRWYDLKFFNFQPSEFLKIFIILSVALLIQYMYVTIKKNRTIYIFSIFKVTKIGRAYFLSFVIVLTLCVFIYLSHALSSALQIILIFLVMYSFYDAIPYIYVSLTTIFVGLAGVVGILSTAYRRDRLGLTEQAQLSLKSIARGGIRGAGYQEGLSRNFYLPEVQTDYVFAGFAEEWGFIGFIFILFLILFLVLLLFYASNFTKTIFEKMVLIGTAVMILNQTILHMLINLSLAPSTGVTLPFLSYGGTSTGVLFIMLAICLSIMLKFNDYLEV